MYKKRGQAALEFLMTYGWAFLVVLVVLGTLTYFGILNPSFLLPEKCTLQLGLYCRDHRIDSDSRTISLRLENGVGKGMLIQRIKIADQEKTTLCDIGIGSFTGLVPSAGCDGITCTACGNFTQAATYDPIYAGSFAGCNPHMKFRALFNGYPGWHIENKEDASVKVPCSKMTQVEGKKKVDIDIVYFYDDSNPDFIHTMGGELLARGETVNI